MSGYKNIKKVMRDDLGFDPQGLNDNNEKYITTAGTPDNPESRICGGNRTIIEKYDSTAGKYQLGASQAAGTQTLLGSQASVVDMSSVVGFAVRRFPVNFLSPAVGISETDIFTIMSLFVPVHGVDPVDTNYVTGAIDTAAVLNDGVYKLSSSFNSGETGVFVNKQTFTAGSVLPSAGCISVSAYEGTDDSDPNTLLYTVDVCCPDWSGKSEGDKVVFNIAELDTGDLSPKGIVPDKAIYITYTSTSPFSLYGNESGNINISWYKRDLENLIIQLDRTIESILDITHKHPSRYMMDTTLTTRTIDVKFDPLNKAGFSVFDAKRKFSTNNCFVKFYNDYEVLQHTVTLNDSGEYNFYYNGTNWVFYKEGREPEEITSNKTSSVVFPSLNIGEIKQFDVSRSGCRSIADLITDGWSVCDGTTPASQGVTNPNITTTPDMKHKFIRMSNDQTSGNTGGSDTHTLTIYEMPAHSHDVSCSNAAGTLENARCGAENGGYFTTESTGGGEAHNNLPAYYELLYFIKVR